jgi:hypothetical protein
MTQVVYVGPYEAVELALPDGDVHVEHGDEVDVPAEVAANLIEQGTWAKPKSSHSKKEEG